MHVFSICTCSAQLSMFHMEKRSRNTLIIIIIIIIIIWPTACPRRGGERLEGLSGQGQASVLLR